MFHFVGLKPTNGQARYTDRQGSGTVDVKSDSKQEYDNVSEVLSLTELHDAFPHNNSYGNKLAKAVSRKKVFPRGMAHSTDIIFIRKLTPKGPQRFSRLIGSAPGSPGSSLHSPRVSREAKVHGRLNPDEHRREVAERAFVDDLHYVAEERVETPTVKSSTVSIKGGFWYIWYKALSEKLGIV